MNVIIRLKKRFPIRKPTNKKHSIFDINVSGCPIPVFNLFNRQPRTGSGVL